MQTEQNKGITLRVVYKRVADEDEALQLDALYIKKRKEVEHMKKDTKKVNEILKNKSKYFRVF